MVGKIVPKSLAKGVDFCGVDDYYYIVQADLNCYMKSSNFHKGSDLSVFSLHPFCTGGDHYLADKDGRFYIIKGNSCRRVTNMSKDLDATVFTLHPNCQGGDHYLSVGDYYYIIFQKRGAYRKTKNMHTDEEGEELIKPTDCKDTLYYFGTKDYFYFVKPDEKWGLKCIKKTNFGNNVDSETFSFHHDVLYFLQPVLHCRDARIMDAPDAPTDIPLPPASNSFCKEEMAGRLSYSRVSKLL